MMKLGQRPSLSLSQIEWLTSAVSFACQYLGDAKTRELHDALDALRADLSKGASDARSQATLIEREMAASAAASALDAMAHELLQARAGGDPRPKTRKQLARPGELTTNNEEDGHGA